MINPDAGARSLLLASLSGINGPILGQHVVVRFVGTLNVSRAKFPI